MAGLILLDTNALLLLGRGEILPPEKGARLGISFITWMEALAYPSMTAGQEQEMRMLLSQFALVGAEPEILELAVSLRRSRVLKLPDAIIAATALWSEAELWTLDAGFSKVPGLKVRAPSRSRSS